MSPTGTNLAITNPLILYRSLIATNRIKPDPAQHRLALHLQNLYDRLIDYEPSTEYSQRLKQLSRVVTASQDGEELPKTNKFGTKGIWTSLLAQKEKRDSLALTRVLTSHEAAMNLSSPQGLMIHGEVGTGKSMLVDLFADCLPNAKKKRCHFNTFMLDAISRLEQLRKAKLVGGSTGMQDEYSLLWLARDLIQKSPILFLDEFQLPDRVASKILSNLMTSFFQLGGVLIATSNRMPEELAKAAGMDFARPVSRVSRLGWTLGLGGTLGRDDGPGQLGEFAKFLEVLRARCEVWEMEGKQDYRRLSGEEDGFKTDSVSEVVGTEGISKPASGLSPSLPLSPDAGLEPPISSIALPKHFFIEPSPTADSAIISTYKEAFNHALNIATSHPNPVPWTPTTLTVYGRPISIPAAHAGTVLFTFSQICGAVLGPADYITLASTYHTFIITDIPILTFHQKNEARRFITLLDALYEARCKLLISAAAAPDDIFFPEPKPNGTAISNSKDGLGDTFGIPTSDATHPETYSEIHQDLTSPFRPNISSYSSSSSSNYSSQLRHDALEDDPPNRVRRHHHHHPASSRSPDDNEERPGVINTKALDFANIRGLTGEDEVFAVKRAQSRVWEMCSGKWWAARAAQTTIEAASASSSSSSSSSSSWRPLPREARHWEGDGDRDGDGDVAGSSSASASASAPLQGGGSDVQMRDDVQVDIDLHIQRKGEYPRADGKFEKDLFPHEGASPFRTRKDEPPKIGWTHVWGTIQWGKGAGAWGKGVEGLGERVKVRDDEEEDGGKERKG